MFKRELINWRKQIGKGFTLIEIVIVIAMLGIIIAIAIPRLVSNDRSDMNPLQQMNKPSIEVHELEPGTYEIYLKECDKFLEITVKDAGG